jgi:outer membrane receptor protein involved in Fe transport
MSVSHPVRGGRRAVLLSSVLLCLSSLHAAEMAEPQEIVIQALRGTKFDDLDISSTVLGGKALQDAPQSSVEELLGHVGGVIIPQLPANELHPTGDGLGMRGFGTTPGRTLIMLDGVPFSDPYLRYVDWQQVPKELIDHVEVIRGGGATTLWGNMAMSGVVNIVTRDPEPDEVRASLGYGSFNALRADAAASLYSDAQWRVGLSGSHEQTDGFNKVVASNQSPIFGPTSSYSNDGVLSVGWRPDQDDQLHLKLGAHYTAERGLQEAISSNGWGSYDAALSGSFGLGKWGGLELTSFYDKWHYATQNANDLCYNQTAITVAASKGCPGNIASPQTASSYLGQIENAPYTTIGGSLVWKAELAPFKDLLAGFDARDTQAHDLITIFSRATPTAAILAKPTVTLQGEHRFQGVFAQGAYRLEDIPLQITVGLREDFWQVSGGAINGVGLEGDSFQHFDPRVGVKYDITPQLALRGAVYQSFAAPGMSSQFRSYVSGTGLSLGNTALLPETNQGGELGMVYSSAWLRLEANAFANSLSNFITSGTLCSSTASCSTVVLPTVFGKGVNYATITESFNAGRALIRGGEVLGHAALTDSLSVDASWSRAVSIITNNDSLAQILGSQKAANSALPTDQQIGGVPAWTAMLSLDWQALPDLHLIATLRAWPNFWAGTNHAASGLDNGAVVADLGASYRLHSHVQLFVDLQNIGNLTYLTSAANYGASTSGPSAIGTPFNVFGGVRVSF